MKTPYAHTPARDEDNTLLLRERDRLRRRELWMMVLALLPLGLGLLVYTWVQLETLATGYRISSLEKDLHDLERTQHQLELEGSELSRPELVEQLALERLGMTRQSHEQTLYFEDLLAALARGLPPLAPTTNSVTTTSATTASATAPSATTASMAGPAEGAPRP